MFLLYLVLSGWASVSLAQHGHQGQGQGHMRGQGQGQAPNDNDRCMWEVHKTLRAYKDAMNAAYTNNLYSLWMNNVANDPRVFSEMDLKMLVFAAEQHEITGVSDATLWYVGGHKECFVGQQIINASHGVFSNLIIFEPTPAFFRDLTKNVPNFNSNTGDKGLVKKVLNNYGMSSKDYTIQSPLLGAATSSRAGSLFDLCKIKENCEELQIRETISALKENRFEDLKNKDNVLYTNCEGCEIDVMQALLNNDLVQYFSVIHIATHYLQNEHVLYAKAHCAISERLEKTHRRVFGIMYAQERWVRR
jgi:hypothetical protein